MDCEVVDFFRELRVRDPHVPRLGGAHRHLHLFAHFFEVDHELGGCEVAAQDAFVADDDAVDVAILLGEIDELSHIHI